jgi:hypothetical protein
MLALGYTPANDTEFLAHAKNGSIHVSEADRKRWNNALSSGFSGNYNDLVDKPEIFNDRSNSLDITDPNGNVVARIDQNGVRAVNFWVKDTDIFSLLKQ